MLEKLEKAPARANKAKHDRTSLREKMQGCVHADLLRSLPDCATGRPSRCMRMQPTVLEVLGLPEHVCSNSTGSSGDLSLLVVFVLFG